MLNDLSKKTCVLVHGAWHGNWCWSKLTPLLEPHFKVIAPNLPGRMPTPTTQRIDLKTHVDFIIDLINQERDPVTLVGHSMAGMIISQVAEKMPQKISGLLYLAAFLPKNNQSLSEIARGFSSPGISTEMTVNIENNIVSLAKSQKTQELFFNMCSEQEAKFALDQLQPEPFQPFIDSVTLSDNNFGKVHKTYVLCSNDKTISSEDQMKMAKDVVNNVISVSADHSPFYSSTQDLAKIILRNNMSLKLTPR